MALFLANSTMENIMLFILLSVVGLGLTMVTVAGEVYKVGDSIGWTASSNSSYSAWTSSKTFHVHDVLLFEYNATIDNVILVTHSEFRSCDTSRPLKTYNSGNDSFTIKSRGHYYFTSNFSGHCQGGQKLDVRVLHSSPHPVTLPPKPVTSPSISPSVSDTTAAPVELKALAPSPTQSKASMHDPKWLSVSTVAVTVSGLVALVNGYA